VPRTAVGRTQTGHHRNKLFNGGTFSHSFQGLFGYLVSRFLSLIWADANSLAASECDETNHDFRGGFHSLSWPRRFRPGLLNPKPKRAVAIRFRSSNPRIDCA